MYIHVCRGIHSKDVCMIFVSAGVVCTDTWWYKIGSYKNVFSFHLWPQQSQLTLKTVQRLAVMIEPQQPGWCWPLSNLITCDIARKLGILRKNATLRIGHQMKRQNSFYVVDVKCLLELQLLLNCPEWGLQQGVNLSIPRQQELVIRRRRWLAGFSSKNPR